MKTQCGVCVRQKCVGGQKMEASFCPMHIHPEIYEKAAAIYQEDEKTAALSKYAAIVENLGYIKWPRLRDIIELSRQMGFQCIALVSCVDMKTEVEKAVSILGEFGFASAAVYCESCRQDDAPDAFSAFARAANAAPPDFFVISGLCVAAEANLDLDRNIPKTTFIARDTQTGDNPAVTLYKSSGWKDWSAEFYSRRNPMP